MVLKSAAFGASWFFLPLWAFLVLGIYFYFVPLFRPLELILPFSLVIFFAAVGPANAWLALFFAVALYLILGVKDLVFINRRSSYEVLALLILFLTLLKFFVHFDSWDGGTAFLAAFLISATFFFLGKGFLRYSSLSKVGAVIAAESHPHESSPRKSGSEGRAKIAAGVMALAVFEFAFALLFLPINFLYQSALLFVAAAIFLEFLADYAAGTLARPKLMVSLSTLFIFLVIILGSAQWSL